ncbi:MAG: hypothetical protein AAB352_01575 [Patescibacteria group bacterium]
MILIFCILFLGLRREKFLQEENEKLVQQLGQAKAEAKDNIGKPITIHNLPDGNYLRAENGQYAFVQMNVDYPVGPKGPHIAVYYEEDVPGALRVNKGSVQPMETPR